MILELFKERETKPYILLFGLGVSIDSFTVGIGLSKLMKFTILCPFTFALVSSLFTYLGLVLGKKVNEIIGNLAIILGGLTIIVLGVYYII